MSLATRARNGIGIYDFSDGWTYVPFDNNVVVSGGTSSSSLVANAIFQHIDSSNQSTIYTSYQDTNATAVVGVNKLRDAGSTGNTKGNFSVMFYVKLPQKMKVSTIELNLSPKYDVLDSSSTVVIPVMTVNYGDGRAPLWNYNQVLSSSTAGAIKVGNSQGQGIVGQQVQLRSADLGGERRYIESIANLNTSNEVWTLDSAFSATPVTGIDIIRTNLYKAEAKNVSSQLIPDNLVYNVTDFFSDKIFIEVIMDAANSSLDIHSITIR